MAGRVLNNTLGHERRAPFGGFEHSSLRRDTGKCGVNAYLEPKTMLMG